MQRVLKVQGLTIDCCGRNVFSNVDFEIPRNSVTAIVGPSGIGKTTLLRSLNRLLEEDPGYRVSGQVHFDGESLWGTGLSKYELRRRVGIVFQKPVIFPISIYRNVTFGAKHVAPQRPRAMRDHVEVCLRNAFLWEEVRERLDEPGLSLSVGQQQRLAIARTLAVKPEILLMDEPTSALDEVATERIESLIHSIKVSQTILVVTHNRNQAERISDQILEFRTTPNGTTASIIS